MKNPTRRQVLIGGASTLAATSLMTVLPGARMAWGREALTIVEWGGPFIEGMKTLVEKQGKYDVTWELHAGGAAAILPKIRSQWPDQLKYDMVAAWTPVFLSMIREGWLETVTPDAVPNISEIPEALINKDDQGNWMTIPRNTGASYFGYREDICPIEIKSIEDFLSPKLKGQIVWPDPTYSTNNQVVMLALARGGNEFNMEPGWDFMKELAKSGNVGHVFKTEAEMINSLSTGQTSVGWGVSTNWVELDKQFPIKHLTKVDDPGLKTALFVEGWAVMKGRRVNAAFDLANFTVSAENNEWWAEAIGAPPVNVNANPPADLGMLVFTNEELEKYCYFPDWDHLSQQVDGWVKRFEQEIVPLF